MLLAHLTPSPHNHHAPRSPHLTHTPSYSHPYRTDRSWLGANIPAAALDTTGAFDVVLARVFDATSGRSRLVLRGRRRAGPAQLVADLKLELSVAARKLGLPFQVGVVLLGQGRVEYGSKQTVRLAWGRVAAQGAPGQADLSAEEQSSAAAALARLGVPQGCVVVGCA